MSNSRFLSTTYGVVRTINNASVGGGSAAPGLEFGAYFGPGGQQRSWANQLVEIRPVSPKQTINGIDINSLIVVLPTGLNQKEIWYASVDLVSTINTAGA